MKRIFFMFLALLLCGMVQAQDNVEIINNIYLVYRSIIRNFANND